MTNHDQTPTLLWQPSPERMQQANLTRFIALVNQRWNAGATDHASLYDWSIREPVQFWESVWDFAGVIGDKGAAPVPGRRRPDARRDSGSRDARLNFAENLLRRRDDETAMVFWGENKVRRTLSFGELYDQVSRTAQALRALGVKAGDRVAGFMPNMPETHHRHARRQPASARSGPPARRISACRACSTASARSSRRCCSASTATTTAARPSTRSAAHRGNRAASCPSLREQWWWCPTSRERADVSATIPNAVQLGDFVAPFRPATSPSSACPSTTRSTSSTPPAPPGVPKCIVHGAGGTLLQHLKEHQLHTDLKRGDRLFYFTTCGWMMWNWLVSGLATGATLLLYDGSPFYPEPERAVRSGRRRSA